MKPKTLLISIFVTFFLAGNSYAAEIVNPSDALYNMAHHQEITGNRTEALRLYRQLLETAPGHPQALHSLILLYLRDGKFSEAIPYARQMQTAEPDMAEGFYFEGLALIRKGEGSDEKAQKLLEKALALDPQKSSTHFMLGVIHYRHGREKAAMDSFQEAVRLEPDFFEPYPFLAALAVRQEDYDAALQYTEKAMSLDPKSGLEQAHARLLIKAGRFPEGIDGLIQTRQFSDAMKAVQKYYHKDEVGLSTWEGIILVREGRLTEAVEALEKAVKAKNALPRAFYELGRLKATLGDSDEARTLLKKALVLLESSDSHSEWSEDARKLIKKLTA